ADGLQKKIKEEPQHHIPEKKQQKKITGTKWKRGDESSPLCTESWNPEARISL
ncbi:UNVERIFIED_CONTAM: hypothetical protein K2H54_063607, partial [Gekko kuhli]